MLPGPPSAPCLRGHPVLGEAALLDGSGGHADGLLQGLLLLQLQRRRTRAEGVREGPCKQYTHIYAPTYTNTNIHTYKRARPPPHTHTQLCTHAYSNTQIHRRKQTNTHMQTNTQINRQTKRTQSHIDKHRGRSMKKQTYTCSTHNNTHGETQHKKTKKSSHKAMQGEKSTVYI